MLLLYSSAYEIVKFLELKPIMSAYKVGNVPILCWVGQFIFTCKIYVLVISMVCPFGIHVFSNIIGGNNIQFHFLKIRVKNITKVYVCLGTLDLYRVEVSISKNKLEISI